MDEAFLGATVSHLEECPDIGPACASARPPEAYYHHVHEILSDTSLDASIGVTRFFAVDTHFVLHVADVHPLYSTLDGTWYADPNEIHHHRETLVGLGDPWLMARFGGSKGLLTTMSRFGFSFPVGRTEENPYALSALGKSHEHLQLGTGTFVPIVGLGVSLAFEPLTLSASATGHFGFYANSQGYRAPMRVYGGLRAELSFFDEHLKPSATFDVDHEGEEYWDGRPGGEGTNVKTAFLLGFGLASKLGKSVEVHAAFKAHLGDLAEGPTRDYAGIFDMGVAFHADLWRPNH